MSDYKPGDWVSLHRSQTSEVQVVAVPEVGGSYYSVWLPIDDLIKIFTFEAVEELSIDDVVTGLVVVLQDGQTPYRVRALGGGAIEIVGPLGLQFVLLVSDGLQTTVLETAVQSLDQHGQPRPPIFRVVESTNRVGSFREFFGKGPDGQPLKQNMLLIRAIDHGETLEVEAGEILMRIAEGM